MNILKYCDLLKDELMLKNYCQNSIKGYCGCLVVFLKQMEAKKYDHPANVPETEIKQYLLTLNSPAYVKQMIGALKIFYVKVIRQPLKFKYIDYPRKETKLPIILSKEEIHAIYKKIDNLKHKSVFILLYSTGMRIGELINLKPSDIDSSQMIIRVTSGKGKKDRNLPLSENCLNILREYYKKYEPKEFLFNGQFTNKYTESSVRQWLNKYKDLSGIKKDVHPHLIRHCAASHLLESGTDISIIQELMGHKNISTTNIYKHISTAHISRISTPDRIFFQS